MMKNIILAAIFTTIAFPALSASVSEPVMEAPVIVEETTANSSSGAFLPLLLFLVIVGVAG